MKKALSFEEDVNISTDRLLQMEKISYDILGYGINLMKLALDSLGLSLV